MGRFGLKEVWSSVKRVVEKREEGMVGKNRGGGVVGWVEKDVIFTHG